MTDLEQKFEGEDEICPEPVISSHKKCMLLKIHVDSEDAELIEKYKESIAKHNRESEAIHYNSGFDLFMPENLEVGGDWFLQTKMIDHRVKCEAFMCEENGGEEESWALIPTGFYLYPRSSMSKEPIMMANHVGIIDSGYRGNLIAAVRSLATVEREIPQYARLFQVCSPTLCPIHVVLVQRDELSNTVRGEGGFGSTDKEKIL